MYRVSVSGDKAILVGTDSRELVALECAGPGEPEFRILTGAQAERWTRKVQTTIGTVGSGSNERRHISVQPDQTQSLPDNRVSGHALPQSSYDEFARARPQRVKDGYARDDTKIQESIGPWQMLDGVLWFGKSFYDGEGITGVGGFGYFDKGKQEFRIFSPPEIADWSVTAMLVEADSIWLGLAWHSEWKGFAGGLLRFDRATERVEKVALRDIVGQIARLGDRLVMATETGVAILDRGVIRRYFVDMKTDSRLRVVEALRE